MRKGLLAKLFSPNRDPKTVRTVTCDPLFLAAVDQSYLRAEEISSGLWKIEEIFQEDAGQGSVAAAQMQKVISKMTFIEEASTVQMAVLLKEFEQFRMSVYDEREEARGTLGESHFIHALEKTGDWMFDENENPVFVKEGLPDHVRIPIASTERAHERAGKRPALKQKALEAPVNLEPAKSVVLTKPIIPSASPSFWEAAGLFPTRRRARELMNLSGDDPDVLFETIATALSRYRNAISQETIKYWVDLIKEIAPSDDPFKSKENYLVRLYSSMDFYRAPSEWKAGFSAEDIRGLAHFYCDKVIRQPNEYRAETYQYIYTYVDLRAAVKDYTAHSEVFDAGDMEKFYEMVLKNEAYDRILALRKMVTGNEAQENALTEFVLTKTIDGLIAAKKIKDLKKLKGIISDNRQQKDIFARHILLKPVPGTDIFLVIRPNSNEAIIASVDMFSERVYDPWNAEEMEQGLHSSVLEKTAEALKNLASQNIPQQVCVQEMITKEPFVSIIRRKEFAEAAPQLIQG